MRNNFPHIHSSPLLPDSSPFPYRFKFVSSLKTKDKITLSLICATYVALVGFTSGAWPTYRGTTFLKILTLPLPAVTNCQLLLGILYGLSLYKLCTCCYNYYEFIRKNSLLHLENTASMTFHSLLFFKVWAAMALSVNQCFLQKETSLIRIERCTNLVIIASQQESV